MASHTTGVATVEVVKEELVIEVVVEVVGVDVVVGEATVDDEEVDDPGPTESPDDRAGVVESVVRGSRESASTISSTTRTGVAGASPTWRSAASRTPHASPVAPAATATQERMNPNRRMPSGCHTSGAQTSKIPQG